IAAGRLAVISAAPVDPVAPVREPAEARVRFRADVKFAERVLLVIGADQADLALVPASLGLQLLSQAQAASGVSLGQLAGGARFERAARFRFAEEVRVLGHQIAGAERLVARAERLV